MILVPFSAESLLNQEENAVSVDATSVIIVADGRKRVKLATGGEPGFAVGEELDHKN